MYHWQGSSQQPAVPGNYQQLLQPDPALHFLLDGRLVQFCTSVEDYRHHHLRPPPAGLFNSVPEHAARLQGAGGTSGIVRVRVNPTGHAPTAITKPVADRLGLQRRPLPGPGIASIWGGGGAVPVEVLTAPLTVQLLSAPGTIAMACSMGVVLVVPSFADPGDELFEVQLGSLDFCEGFDVTVLPAGVNQYTERASGHSCVVPLVAPKQSRSVGTSSFNVVGESLDEVMDLLRVRRASLARQRAAAADRTGASSDLWFNAAEGAAAAGRQRAVASQAPVQGQLQRNIQRPSAPGHQQQLPQPCPALHFLLDGRQVTFCTTEEDYRHHHLRPPPAGLFNSVPEHAARLQGPYGASGIVRVRVNPTGHAPSAITRRVVDLLGLRTRPLQGPGALFMCETGEPLPLWVLLEPLTVQLLSGPGTVALGVTLPAVVVVPSRAEAGNELFELQLGLLDFCKVFDAAPAPPWACQFTHRASGHQSAVPFVAPKQWRSAGGSSSFNVLEDSYDEVTQLIRTRRAMLARHEAAAAAAAAGAAAAGAAAAGAAAAGAAAAGAAAAGARSPVSNGSAQAAAEALPQEIFFSGLAIAVTTPLLRAAAASSSNARVETDDESAPPQLQHQHQRAQHNQQPGWRSRGSEQQQAASNDFVSAAGRCYCAGMDLKAEEHARAAAASSTGVYTGLDPLPAGLVACRWSQVAATSLPRADATCSICFEDFADRLVDGGVRFVTQLRCRHTFCVLCLRRCITSSDACSRRPLQCPQCREEV